jgi:hypothetical protein
VGLDGGGDDSSDPAVVNGYKKPKGKKLPPAKKRDNQLIAAERAVCEHARLPFRKVSPSTCSANIACPQARSRQRKRRTRNSMSTRRPPTAWSAGLEREAVE